MSEQPSKEEWDEYNAYAAQIKQEQKWREEFERWASDPIRSDKLPLTLHPDGAYSDHRTYIAFYAWKAARAIDAQRIAELESQVAISYGFLWHVNCGIGAPADVETISITPDKAAIEARLALRDLLTSEQRGKAINSVRDKLEAAAPQPEDKP